MAEIIMVVDWNTFKQRFMAEKLVFVHEDDLFWHFYSSAENGFIVKTSLQKPLDPTETLMFIEQNFAGYMNLVKVKNITTSEDFIARADGEEPDEEPEEGDLTSTPEEYDSSGGENEFETQAEEAKEVQESQKINKEVNVE